MTTHDDLHDVETMLRASLRERADDVQTTPALYERVQRQAQRGTWLRRGFAVAAVAAAAAGAVAVLPSLLPDPTPFDVVDTPEESLPSDDPTALPAPDAFDGFVARGLAVAEAQADGTTEIRVGARTVVADQPVVSLATGMGGVVVAGLADGTIGGINLDGTGTSFDQVIDADANGGAVVSTPLGDGVAWIEGTDLHLLPLADGSAVRVQPLEGDVPDDLRIEQWFAQADAQVVLASSPDGGVWSLPMDDSDVSDTGPTTPGFVLAEDAVDTALLVDLTRLEVAVDQGGDGVVLRFAGDPATEVALGLPAGTDVALTTDGQRIALHDRATGTGEFYEDARAVGVEPPMFSWADPTILAVAPLLVIEEDVADPVEVGPAGDDAAALGLPTGAPVIGTDGVDLVIRRADGTVIRREVYPSEESEATLGDLAVRPGSSEDTSVIAVESTSEGEPSIRFVVQGPTSLEVSQSILLTDGEVTGLVWSEDGDAIAWTDASGLQVATVDDSGQVIDSFPVYDGTRPVIDWTWTDDDGTRTSGQFAVRVDGDGTQFLGVDRFSNGEVVATGPGGGGDRLFLDAHASPGAAVGPEVHAAVSDAGVVDLFWYADGDRFGDLPAPGLVGGSVRVDVSGGQVLVLGAERQVLVTFDGVAVDLPFLTDWDVLD